MADLLVSSPHDEVVIGWRPMRQRCLPFFGTDAITVY